MREKKEIEKEQEAISHNKIKNETQFSVGWAQGYPTATH